MVNCDTFEQEMAYYGNLLESRCMMVRLLHTSYLC